MMKKIFLLPLLIVAAVFIFTIKERDYNAERSLGNLIPNTLPSTSSAPDFAANLMQPPQRKVLQNNYHVFQTFNNCGPASLSMVLSYFGINETQEKLGQDLRPYQNATGDNDDKSVTLGEMAEKAQEYGLIPFHRPGGDIEKIKLFIANDIPIIARTWTKVNEDIGHYRVIKGYDESTKQIIQDDSLQNKNLWFSYETFNTMWEKFNFEYLVLVPQEQMAIAEAILADDQNSDTAWQKAVQSALSKLKTNPDDIYSRFNLSVAYYNIGNYQQSVTEFEKVEEKLPFRTLWYQIEPIEAYFELGNYQKVLSISDKILSNGNRAFSELYLIRGQIYLKQGNKERAKQEFEKAVLYNKNLKKAQSALNFL